jgi:uncharacterized membrane protein
MVEALTVLGAIACAGIGGVFFAFSGFVMAALRRLPPSRGASAMQSINVTAVRPPLMIALFGTAAVCVALVVRGIATWGDRAAALLTVGGGVYLVGVIGMTIAFHVPRNEALARANPDDPTGQHEWARYLREWTAGNHVRTAAGLLAGALLALSLVGTE